MPGRILVVNAGSSSLKLRVIDADDRIVAEADLPAPGRSEQPAALARSIRELADRAGGVDAVGHRVVHGGRRHEAVLLDADIEAELEGLTALAPLHQPRALAGIAAARAALPDLPEVACFDTAFHARLPDAAATYALPERWRDRWGLRRAGFHGLSHAWAARRAAALAIDLDASTDRRRIITCHLGAGASLAAILDGRSIDTTMGFTPNDGLVMATRSGSVDPGLLVWLATTAAIPVDELGRSLELDSGLAGLAGTPDMRAVLAAEASGDARAALAIGVYLHRLRASIGAMAAALDGVDILVFTGGVGEHAPAIRARASGGLTHLGIAIDGGRNERTDGADTRISTDDSTVLALVVTAREDLEIAASTRAVLDAGGPWQSPSGA